MKNFTNGVLNKLIIGMIAGFILLSFAYFKVQAFSQSDNVQTIAENSQAFDELSEQLRTEQEVIDKARAQLAHHTDIANKIKQEMAALNAENDLRRQLEGLVTEKQSH